MLIFDCVNSSGHFLSGRKERARERFSENKEWNNTKDLVVVRFSWKETKTIGAIVNSR